MKIDYYTEIKKRYGNIKRARGYYIYTEKNIRLIDMYLDGGTSIAGRRTGQAKLILKQKIDKGLMLEMPTQAEHQLKKVLNSIFPSHPQVRVFKSEKTAFDICEKNYAFKTPEEILWRFCAGDKKAALLQRPCFVVKSCFPTDCGILIFNPDKMKIAPPKSDTIFSAELFAIVRSFHDIKYASVQIQKNLQTNIEPSFLSGLQKIWHQNGIYLTPKIAPEKYTELFIKALDSHIFISPNFYQPSVFPLLKTYTELKKFLNIF
ncbi:MAG: hypothetical protein CR988_06300 [Treponema sp.]|nr:MAG: hypothetical protein CR988_06300 [Treponema sp.]